MDEIKPGLWPDILEESYHKLPGINKHSLDDLEISPAHYQAGKAIPMEPTRAMIVGKALHTAILEPEFFRLRFAVNNYFKDFRTKAAQIWRDECQADGVEVLTRDEYRQAFYMADSLRTHGTASKLLNPKDVTREQTAIWIDDDAEQWAPYERDPTYFLCRGRADVLNYRYSAIIDVKKTEIASEEKFRREIIKRRYDVQAAWYMDGFRKVGFDAKIFIFIAIEPKPPYAVGVYHLSSDDLNAARTKYRSNLVTLRDCQDMNHWPAYPDELRKITLTKEY